MAPGADEPAAGSDAPGVPALPIPEIRDYQRINAELVRLLDAGHQLVKLVGAEGQRLLVAGLSGGWDAIVEIEGPTGPELAASLNAPKLTVVCHGPAADGAGSGLRGGRLVVRGDAGPVVGYAQRGGTIVVVGAAGPRAGLNQSGGVLVLLGPVGPLAGERQSGGHVFAHADRVGHHAARGRQGGTLVVVSSHERLEVTETEILTTALTGLDAWLPAGETWRIPSR